MSKYDEAAVDALIDAVDKIGFERHYPSIKTALEALRPKPEMEYVLCEFKPDWRDLDGEPMMYAVANGETRSYSKSEWSYLREATRIPARPKVRAITAQELRDIYNSIGIPLDRDIWPEIANAINAKQGTKE